MKRQPFGMPGSIRILMLASVLGGGCAAVPTGPTEPIVWSAEWFQCEGRFQCIIVYDAYCNFTPVNSSHARTYEAWANQEVRRTDEHIPCPPPGNQPAPLPLCRKGQCEVF